MELLGEKIMGLIEGRRRVCSVTVDVSMVLPSAPQPSRPPGHPRERGAPERGAPERARVDKTVSFEPAFECDNGGPGRGPSASECSFALAVDGVRFQLTHDVIQALATTWLEECAEEHARGRGPSGSVECECCVVAAVKGLGSGNKIIYKRSVKVTYFRDGGHRNNKKAVSKLAGELARVKNLCLNMLPPSSFAFLPGMSPPV